MDKGLDIGDYKLPDYKLPDHNACSPVDYNLAKMQLLVELKRALSQEKTGENQMLEPTDTHDTVLPYLHDQGYIAPSMEKNNPIEVMRKQYPTIAQEFERLQYEQLQLFSRKMLDYGVENISVGTKLETEQETKLSLTGLYFRMNDKISRLKQLVALNKDSYVTTENVQDTFMDLSIYGMIAQIVANGKWR